MIFGHIFCKDPIDIHEQVYGTLKLSMYRSCPQSDFSVTFFSKELSHKINCPVHDEMFRFFPEKNQFSYRPPLYIFLIYFGLKSCFSYNLIICEHDAWHYLIKFWIFFFTTLVWNTEESPFWLSNLRLFSCIQSSNKDKFKVVGCHDHNLNTDRKRRLLKFRKGVASRRKEFDPVLSSSNQMSISIMT